MTKVVKLSKIRQSKADGKTLCRSGFHKWKVATKAQFDVKLGKLVTREECERCGESRNKLT